jgi:hypothetical protein
VSLAGDRDGGQCVSCGALPGRPLPVAEHHRILGNTDDERASNKLTLCGTGNVPPGCHGEAHSHRKVFGDPRGYIVSRHGPREATLDVPVWYDQIALGRVGWFLLDDAGGLVRAGRPPLLAAGDHVVYCRGCQHAWVDTGASLIDSGPGECACTCTDPADPHYEDWVTDPDPADIPAGAWTP